MPQPAAKPRTSPPTTRVERLARYFWPVATGLLCIRVIVDAQCNLVPDEAFYWTWTRHLSTGYFDHPPMIAWIIWLSTRLFGNTEVGVRLPASVLSLGALAVLYKIAKEVLADERAVGFVVLMWIVGPLLPVIGTIITPDAPATFFSVCALACAVKLAAVDESETPPRNVPRLWLAFGSLCGLAFLSKYTTVLVPASVGLAFLTSRRGLKHFSRPWIYLAAAVSLIVFSPCIYWNYRHHWASFAFQLNHGAGGGLTEGVNGSFRKLLLRGGGLAQFLGGQALVWTPVLFLVMLAVLISNWASAVRLAAANFGRGRFPLFNSEMALGTSEAPSTSLSRVSRLANLGKIRRLSEVDWLLLWAGTLPLLFFGFASTRSHGEINWPAFAYFPLSLLIGRYLQENWTGIRVQWTTIGCQVALGFAIGMHMLAFPGLQQWLLRHRVHITHQVTDLWGWKQFGRELQLQTIGFPVVCNRHQDAGEAAFYMPGQPDVWCDGVGSRTTAFDFFDHGIPDYDHLPEVAFVGGHVDLFKKKHGYTQTKEVMEVIMPGLGKNRSHTVTIVGR